MRIVAGRYGGLGLFGPRKGSPIRPTTDRVREALFGRLGARVEGASVADLFAGTGAVAIEALSRGAARAVLVDLGRDAIDLQKRNLGLCRPPAAARIMQRKVEAWLRKTEDRFDLVFADPPYGYDLAALCRALGEAELLAPGGLFVLEHGVRDVAPDEDPWWILDDRRSYGGTCLSSYVSRSSS